MKKTRLLLVASALLLFALVLVMTSCDLGMLNLPSQSRSSTQAEITEAVIYYDPGQGLLPDGEWRAEFEIGEVYYNHPTPTRQGYKFTGWYEDEECTKLVSNGKVYKNAETTLYAGWEPLLGFTVTFVTGCEAEVDNQKVFNGEKITEPQAPEKQGYTLDGWYCDGEKWAFDEKAVDGDITLEAVWVPVTYKITFVTDGEVVGWGEFTVETENITEPQVPTKEGYTGKWESYVLSAQDITVNAEYEAIVYKVIFVADGVTVDEVEFTVESSEIEEPQPPTKQGYTGKWESYELSARNITVNAEYEAIVYKVIFVADGVTVDEVEFTVESSEIEEPQVPAKEGYIGQWESYVLSTENITVSAVYELVVVPEPEKETVTVKFNTGVGYFENNKYIYSVEKNGFFTGAFPTPVSDNPAYEFIGWYRDAEYTRAASPSDLYTADTELYSCWITVPQCIDGSYDHAWSYWEETTAPTCTKAGVKARFCTICNAESTMTGSPAAGHDWGRWVDAFLARTRTCKALGCGYEQRQEFENITLSTLGNKPKNQLILQMAYGWGADRVGCLIDGSWDQTDPTVFSANACEVKVTINLVTVSKMDRIYVKGRGAGSSFNVYVQYEGDSDYTLLGVGSFLSETQNADKDNRKIPYVEVDNTRNVVSVQVVMPTCSQGQDYWEEIAFMKIPALSNGEDK